MSQPFLSASGKDIKIALCFQDASVFRRAGYFTTVNASKQVIVWKRGRKLLKWSPFKKWVWFYGSHSSDGEHLGPGKGVAYLLKHLDKYRKRQIFDRARLSATRRKCRKCSGEFTPAKPHFVFCSPACSNAWWSDDYEWIEAARNRRKALAAPTHGN